MERLQLTIHKFSTKINSMNLKVDGKEVKMEAKNVGVIKDVFDILEMHPPSVQPASHS